MKLPEITVVTPTIGPRELQLHRARFSVDIQTYTGEVRHLIVEDENHDGAPITRQRGLDAVDTEWVAFLDDDDEFLQQHLERLMWAANEHDADYVYSWYNVIGGTDPRPEEFGRPWDPSDPRQTTITTLVRTNVAQAAGFLLEGGETEDLTSPDRHYAGEDWRFTKRIADSGATIFHLPEKTWLWYHWHNGTHGNTSGLPKNW